MAQYNYDMGEAAHLTATFKTRAPGSVLADPTTVKLTVVTPNNVATTYTFGVGSVIVKSGVGEYYADIDLNEAGTYRFVWAGTGTLKVVETTAVFVRSLPYTS